MAWRFCITCSLVSFNSVKLSSTTCDIFFWFAANLFILLLIYCKSSSETVPNKKLKAFPTIGSNERFDRVCSILKFWYVSTTESRNILMSAISFRKPTKELWNACFSDSSYWCIIVAVVSKTSSSDLYNWFVIAWKGKMSDTNVIFQLELVVEITSNSWNMTFYLVRITECKFPITLI